MLLKVVFNGTLPQIHGCSKEKLLPKASMINLYKTQYS